MRGPDGGIGAALYITRAGTLPDRDWIAAQLGKSEAVAPELLAGRALVAQANRGPIVCVCYDVGETTITNAIASAGLNSVEAVGKSLSAGTNCGSCRLAIAKLLLTKKELIKA